MFLDSFVARKDLKNGMQTERRNTAHRTSKDVKRKSSTDTMGSSASSAEAHYTHRITPVGSPRSDGMNEEKAKLGESRIQLGVASIHVEPR